jgi:hypothetical protein
MNKAFFHGLSVLVAFVAANCYGQTNCSDWSPYFDQIDDPAAVQQLQSQRAQGWPSFNPANNGGASLQQSVAQGDQLIAQIRQQMAQTYQAWSATRGSNLQSINVTHAECQSAAGANMAAACEYHNERNELLGVEGMNDLMRCRASMPEGQYGAMPVAGGGENAGPLTAGGYAAYQQGANSVAELNVTKRGAMVNSALRNWQAPTEQADETTSLAQNTSLADPFADSKGSQSQSNDLSDAVNGASTIENDPDASAPAAVTDSASDNGNRWSDPLAADAGGGDQEAPPPQTASSPPSPAEVASALDSGTLNASETSATPVMQVADAEDWGGFTSTPGSSISVPTTPDSTLVTGDATDQQIDDIFSRYGKYAPEESIGVTALEPLVHQENKLLNDIDAASGALFDPNSPPGSAGEAFNRVESDFAGLGPALATGVSQAIKEKVQDGIQELVFGDNPAYKLIQNAKDLYEDVSQRIQDWQAVRVLPQNLSSSSPPSKCSVFATNAQECAQ